LKLVDSGSSLSLRKWGEAIEVQRSEVCPHCL
jgi:hypothetical protein